MRRAVVFMVVGALLLALTAGVATARTFICDEKPCFGTNKQDMIGERNGNGVSDDIRARSGDDTVNARRFGNDRDEVHGGKGDDRITTDDGDGRDFIDGGPGKDTCIKDPGDKRRDC